MKTPKEILKEKGIDDILQIDTSLPYPKGLRYLTSEAMKDYAKMWVAKALHESVITDATHLLVEMYDKEIDAQ
jgi:hypothetical protein